MGKYNVEDLTGIKFVWEKKLKHLTVNLVTDKDKPSHVITITESGGIYVKFKSEFKLDGETEGAVPNCILLENQPTEAKLREALNKTTHFKNLDILSYTTVS